MQSRRSFLFTAAAAVVAPPVVQSCPAPPIGMFPGEVLGPAQVYGIPYNDAAFLKRANAYYFERFFPPTGLSPSRGNALIEVTQERAAKFRRPIPFGKAQA